MDVADEVWQEVQEDAASLGLSAADAEEAFRRFGAQREAAWALAAEKGVENLTFDELLAASSLGSAVSLYIASKAPTEEVMRRLRD